MAAGKRTTYRRQSHTENRYGQFYVYGNVVHQPKVLPNQEKQAVEVRPKKRASSQVKKNRRRALDMSPVYTGFLTMAAICAVIICVVYLQLQAELVQRSENITALQSELADLTEANDTAYNAATDSVNLQEWCMKKTVMWWNITVLPVIMSSNTVTFHPMGFLQNLRAYQSRKM